MNNRLPQQFMRVYFWACVSAVILYIIFSAVFYSIGSMEFNNFQRLVFSHPLAYVIIASIVLVPLLAAFFFKPRNEY